MTAETSAQGAPKPLTPRVGFRERLRGWTSRWNTTLVYAVPISVVLAVLTLIVAPWHDGFLVVAMIALLLALGFLADAKIDLARSKQELAEARLGATIGMAHAYEVALRTALTNLQDHDPETVRRLSLMIDSMALLQRVTEGGRHR